MSGDSYLQFIVILIIFVGILALTYYVTKWMAGYQKTKSLGCNIEVIETSRISTTKYVQIIRIADKYMAIGVGKDEITALCEVDKDSILIKDESESNMSFKEVLEKIKGEFKK